jgi:hypothetical protein
VPSTLTIKVPKSNECDVVTYKKYMVLILSYPPFRLEEIFCNSKLGCLLQSDI